MTWASRLLVMENRPAWIEALRGIVKPANVWRGPCSRGRGCGEVHLHTTAEFPTRALNLYTSVGFRVLKVFPRYRKQP